jgi:hypothetical protein
MKPGLLLPIVSIAISRFYGLHIREFGRKLFVEHALVCAKVQMLLGGELADIISEGLLRFDTENEIWADREADCAVEQLQDFGEYRAGRKTSNSETLIVIPIGSPSSWLVHRGIARVR